MPLKMEITQLAVALSTLNVCINFTNTIELTESKKPTVTMQTQAPSKTNTSVIVGLAMINEYDQNLQLVVDSGRGGGHDIWGSD